MLKLLWRWVNREDTEDVSKQCVPRQDSLDMKQGKNKHPRRHELTNKSENKSNNLLGLCPKPLQSFSLWEEGVAIDTFWKCKWSFKHWLHSMSFYFHLQTGATSLCIFLELPTEPHEHQVWVTLKACVLNKFIKMKNEKIKRSSLPAEISDSKLNRKAFLNYYCFCYYFEIFTRLSADAPE